MIHDSWFMIYDDDDDDDDDDHDHGGAGGDGFVLFVDNCNHRIDSGNNDGAMNDCDRG